jgi:hypothetical protein
MGRRHEMDLGFVGINEEIKNCIRVAAGLEFSFALPILKICLDISCQLMAFKARTKMLMACFSIFFFLLIDQQSLEAESATKPPFLFAGRI